MRKALIAFIAIVSLLSAGLLVAESMASKSRQHASKAQAGLDIVGLSRSARDLPEQSFPAH